MILVLITLKVSNTGMHSVATVKGIRPRFSPTAISLFDDNILVTNAEKIIPNDNVPASPMNIFECLPNTLCRKNGKSEKPTIAASVAILILPSV